MEKEETLWVEGGERGRSEAAVCVASVSPVMSMCAVVCDLCVLISMFVRRVCVCARAVISVSLVMCAVSPEGAFLFVNSLPAQRPKCVGKTANLTTTAPDLQGKTRRAWPRLNS